MNSLEFQEICLQNRKFIDVRAPIEFSEGHLSSATNLPILDNNERETIGKTYKKEGREKAINLGYQLVSGDAKAAKIRLWIEEVKKNPELVLYCFRGGLRSQITQKWLAEEGFNVPLISGGIKSARQYYLDKLNELAPQFNYCLISGPTGSGKTDFLNKVSHWRPTIDLENKAAHKGSAFGGDTTSQPPQVNFENSIAHELTKIYRDQSVQLPTIILEDESRMIGRRAIPKVFFEKMRQSPVIWIDEKFETRVENIFRDYILNSGIGKNIDSEAELVFNYFEKATNSIRKRLGGLKTDLILKELKDCRQNYFKKSDIESNKKWIQLLLRDYYDPMYLDSLDRRNVTVLFRGSFADSLQYIKNFDDRK